MTGARIASKALTALLCAAEALAITVALYLGAAAAGSIALPPSWTATDGRQVTIFVVDNGYHIDLVLPAVDEARDWRPLLSASPITANGLDAMWVAFGWGSRAAYTEVGTLSDLTLATMLRALAFDRTVMHVLPLAGVGSGAHVRAVRMEASRYAALADRVAASFARAADGEVRPLSGVTQGYGDAYFEAVGRFSPFRTCNVWAGDMLRPAGVPVGGWTPFAAPLMKELCCAVRPAPSG